MTKPGQHQVAIIAVTYLPSSHYSCNLSSRLQDELGQQKEKWDRQIIDVSRSQVNKDIYFIFQVTRRAGSAEGEMGQTDHWCVSQPGQHLSRYFCNLSLTCLCSRHWVIIAVTYLPGYRMRWVSRRRNGTDRSLMCLVARSTKTSTLSSRLHDELGQQKDKWDRQIIDVSRSQVNKDIELQALRENEDKLKADILQKKQDIERYQTSSLGNIVVFYTFFMVRYNPFE